MCIIVCYRGPLKLVKYHRLKFMPKNVIIFMSTVHFAQNLVMPKKEE